MWIPATFKSNRYAQWKEKTKVDNEDNNDDEEEDNTPQNVTKGRPNTHWARHNEKIKLKQRKSEMKSTDQILKARQIAEKKKQRQKGKKGRGKGKGKRPRK